MTYFDGVTSKDGRVAFNLATREIGVVHDNFVGFLNEKSEIKHRWPQTYNGVEMLGEVGDLHRLVLEHQKMMHLVTNPTPNAAPYNWQKHAMTQVKAPANAPAPATVAPVGRPVPLEALTQLENRLPAGVDENEDDWRFLSARVMHKMKTPIGEGQTRWLNEGELVALGWKKEHVGVVVRRLEQYKEAGIGIRVCEDALKVLKGMFVEQVPAPVPAPEPAPAAAPGAPIEDDTALAPECSEAAIMFKRAVLNALCEMGQGDFAKLPHDLSWVSLIYDDEQRAKMDRRDIEDLFMRMGCEEKLHLDGTRTHRAPALPSAE